VFTDLLPGITLIKPVTFYEVANVQDAPGGKVNIFGCHTVGHSKQKMYMCKCPIPNGFRDASMDVIALIKEGQNALRRKTDILNTSGKVH
jgi:hypothetical protein